MTDAGIFMQNVIGYQSKGEVYEDHWNDYFADRFVIQYLSDRSQTVSSTRSVRNELSTFNISLFVYTANDQTDKLPETALCEDRSAK